MPLETLVWLLSVPVIAVLHEAGHALAARPAGYRVTSFGVGHGVPLVRWRTRRGVIVYLGRWLISGGACVAIPVDPQPKRRWLYHSGGLLLQALLALGLWPLLRVWPELRGAWAFNLLVIAWNLLPIRVGAYATDGWHLLAPWLGPLRSGPLYAERRGVQGVLRVEERVQAPLGVTWCRLMLKWMDVLVGADDDGWEPDEVLLISEPRLEALHTYVRAERHRVEGRSLASLALIDALKQAFGATLPERSQDLISLAEARAWLAQGAPRRASEAVARVAGAPGAVANDAVAIQLEIALQGDDADRVQRAALRLSDCVGRPFMDGPAAIVALWDAAVHLKHAGQLQLADELAAVARRAAGRAVGSAVPDDRVALACRLGQVAGVRTEPPSADTLRG